MKKFNKLPLNFVTLFIFLLTPSVAISDEIQVNFVAGDILSNNRPIKLGDTVRINDTINLPKKSFLVLKFNLGFFTKKIDGKESSIQCTRRLFIQGERSYVVEKETTMNECSEVTRWDDASLERLKSGESFLYKKTDVFLLSEKSENRIDPDEYSYILQEKERNSLSNSSPVTPPKPPSVPPRHPPSAPTQPLPPATTQNPDNSSQLTYAKALELYNRGRYSNDDISIKATDTVENSLIVPLSVSTKISNDQKLWISFNNQHLAMTKNVSNKALVSFKTRLKINKPGAILVMAQHNDHIRAKAQRISRVNKQLRYSNPKPVQLNSWINNTFATKPLFSRYESALVWEFSQIATQY